MLLVVMLLACECFSKPLPVDSFPAKSTIAKSLIQSVVDLGLSFRDKKIEAIEKDLFDFKKEAGIFFASVDVRISAIGTELKQFEIGLSSSTAGAIIISIIGYIYYCLRILRSFKTKIDEIEGIIKLK